MKVTNVRINKLENSTNALKAYVDITFEDAITVDGFKIMENAKGAWLSSPSRKDAEGAWQDTFRFASPELKNDVQEQVLAYYSGGSQKTKKGSVDTARRAIANSRAATADVPDESWT
jgi:stage V sporulation protein G